jgi:hypothetical protein
MEQEIKQENQENAENNQDENAEGGTPETKQADIQKMIDTAVTSRLSRERDKTKQLELSWKTEKEEFEKELTFFRTEFGKILDKRLEDVPDEYKSLVQKLTLSEQVEWLSAHQTEKEELPEIPNFNKKQSNDGGEEIQHRPIRKII